VITDTSDEARKVRAEAKFKKQEERSREAQQVHSENAAKARAVGANTARLKGMRLAKEAGEAAEKATKPDGGHARKDKGKPPPPLVANPDEVKGG
jgi:hypothetical protein